MSDPTEEERILKSMARHGYVPAEADAVRIRRLYDYVEDIDLWRHSLPQTKEFSSAMGARNIVYDVQTNADLFTQLLTLDADVLCQEGVAIQAENQRAIQSDIARAYTIRLRAGAAEAACLAIETDHYELRSEMGNQLAEVSRARGLAPIGCICKVDGDEVKVSLRSLGTEDTTVFTQLYGGGGHRNASGCCVSRAELSRWKTSA